MIRKSTATTICVLACVCTFIVASVLTAGAGLAFLSGAGMLNRAATPEETAQPTDYSRLDEIRRIYHTYALNDVDDQDLLDGAAMGMAYGSGDLYSQFFTEEDFSQYTSQESGNYVGIGVLVGLDKKDSLLTVTNVFVDSPAEKAGMRIGDKLIGVNGADITAMAQEDVIGLVKGESGTEVSIAVLRGEDEVVLTMVRSAVAVNYTKKRMLDGGIGYIQLYEFGGDIDNPNNAYAEFKKDIEDLKSQGMKGLLLDLRNNPGGNLDIAQYIADELLPAGPIVSMLDRNGDAVKMYDPKSRRQVDKLESDAHALGLPLVVLVNENSASASELLCGDIQDYRVGTLVGVTTFGKGIAQTFRSLADGSVLKYTYAKYLTGGGRCPQTVGIQPDVEVELDDAVKKDPMLLCTDRDNQYQRGIEELGKMINK
jgi:carboxyl-terminal processing protease